MITTTWGEIQARSLQKMFLVESSEVERNEVTSTYLAAMPGAYNEAVQLLSTTNRYIVKKFTLNCTGDGGMLELSPKEDVEDLFMIKANGIYYVDNYGKRTRFNGYNAMDAVIYFPNTAVGCRYEIMYYAYPIKVTVETPDEMDLQIDPDVAALVPLYIASQLFKDDDVSIATMYRNEFEIGRELLLKEAHSMMTSRFVSVTGFWS